MIIAAKTMIDIVIITIGKTRSGSVSGLVSSALLTSIGFAVSDMFNTIADSASTLSKTLAISCTSKITHLQRPRDYLEHHFLFDTVLLYWLNWLQLLQ